MIQAKIKENYDKLLYASRLFKYNQQDREDLTHDTIIKAIDKSDQWNGGDVYKWMVSIMRRLSIDQHRKAKPNLNNFDTTDTTSPYRNIKTSDLNPEQSRLYTDKQGIIKEAFEYAVSQIKPTLSKIYMMHVEGMKPKQIAEKTGLTNSCVRTRIHTAKKAIKRELQNSKYCVYLREYNLIK